MDYCTVKQFSALEKGGRMAILVGDIKKKRKLYSMILEMSKPGTIEQIIIKAQYNCFSDSVRYSGEPFVRIVHEYLLVLRKDNSLIFNFQITRNIPGDIRDLKIPTWKDIVLAVMEEKQGPVTLCELYKAIEGHKRTQDNKNWQEKIRQTLHMYEDFESISRGIWRLAPKGQAGFRTKKVS